MNALRMITQKYCDMKNQYFLPLQFDIEGPPAARVLRVFILGEYGVQTVCTSCHAPCEHGDDEKHGYNYKKLDDCDTGEGSTPTGMCKLEKAKVQIVFKIQINYGM